MFFLLRVFHVHHYHDVPDDEGRACPAGLAHEHEPEHDGDHDHDNKVEPGVKTADTEHNHSDHGHGHGHSHDHDHGAHSHQLTWAGLLMGLAIHTLLDGAALGAAVAASHGGDLKWAGLGTFAAILLHKPLDALSITALMRAGGWPVQSRTLVNISFSLMCPLGAVLYYLGAAQMGDDSLMIGCTLGFSAGFFICIALGDLLPEVAFHSHDRIKLSTAMVVGVMLSFAIEWVHQQAHPPHDIPKGSSQGAAQVRSAEEAALTRVVRQRERAG